MKQLLIILTMSVSLSSFANIIDEIGSELKVIYRDIGSPKSIDGFATFHNKGQEMRLIVTGSVAQKIWDIAKSKGAQPDSTPGIDHAQLIYKGWDCIQFNLGSNILYDISRIVHSEIDGTIVCESYNGFN